MYDEKNSNKTNNSIINMTEESKTWVGRNNIYDQDNEKNILYFILTINCKWLNMYLFC